jgi:hypothetical protein
MKRLCLFLTLVVVLVGPTYAQPQQGTSTSSPTVDVIDGSKNPELIVEAARANAAIGVPYLFHIWRRPVFWLVAAPLFALVFWVASAGRQK